MIKKRLSLFFTVTALSFLSCSTIHAVETAERGFSLALPRTTLAALNYLPKLDRFVYHTIGRFLSDTVVELEDGSQWKASFNDSYQLSTWRAHDWIMITPKHWGKNEYSYYLNNYTAGSYVEVNLVLGPLVGGVYTNTICGMDLNYGKIYLSNGTYWQVAQGDLESISDWTIGHSIIFGSNDSWFSSYRALLINVNLNESIFAKEI